jgi:hypothetical protein
MGCTQRLRKIVHDTAPTIPRALGKLVCWAVVSTHARLPIDVRERHTLSPAALHVAIAFASVFLVALAALVAGVGVSERDRVGAVAVVCALLLTVGATWSVSVDPGQRSFAPPVEGLGAILELAPASAPDRER